MNTKNRAHRPAASLHDLATLTQRGDFKAVEKHAEQFVRRDSNQGHAWSFLGIAQLALGKDAFTALQQAASLLPQDPSIRLNLAMAAKHRGAMADAAHYCQEAIALRPDYAKAHMNLGAILLDMGKIKDAIAASERALALQPDYPAAMTNLLNALKLSNDDAAYLKALLRSLELSPDNAKNHLEAAYLLEEKGTIEQAKHHLRLALQLIPGNFGTMSAIQFNCSYRFGYSDQELLEQACEIGQRFTAAAQPWQRWPNIPDPGRRLKLGFVSPDFRRQSVGLFVENIFAGLTEVLPERVELYAYNVDFFDADENTERIKSHCAGWTNVLKMPDQALAERIRRDGIDILFDLSGHTGYNRLPMFAWQPAPIQVSWIGYLGTTGLPAMDYLIADPWTLPETEEKHFSEKIVRLPETYLCFRPPAEAAIISPLPAADSGHITFGSFNNPHKISHDVLATWAKILHAVPDSRLLFKYSDFSDEAMCQRFRSFFHDLGIDPLRLEFMGRVPHAEHLPTYNRVDIALDPFPYPGVTTTVEALWMGVPVITLAGSSFISRQGGGMMNLVGLQDWIADSREDYVSKAAALATDLSGLARIRRALRPGLEATALLDQRRFAVQFEALVRELWTAWCSRNG